MEEDITIAILKHGRCEECGGLPAMELHECPFAAEIFQDYSECNCCDHCTGKCAMDI